MSKDDELMNKIKSFVKLGHQWRATGLRKILRSQRSCPTDFIVSQITGGGNQPPHRELEERLANEREVISGMITTGTVASSAPSGAGKTVWVLGSLFKSIRSNLIKAQMSSISTKMTGLGAWFRRQRWPEAQYVDDYPSYKPRPQLTHHSGCLGAAQHDTA